MPDTDTQLLQEAYILIAESRSGSDPLGDGYVFHWMFDKDGKEIYGHIADKAGKTVDKSSGWYRTNDNKKALEIAKGIIGKA